MISSGSYFNHGSSCDSTSTFAFNSASVALALFNASSTLIFVLVSFLSVRLRRNTDFNGKGGCKRSRGHRWKRYSPPCENWGQGPYYEGSGSDRYAYCQKGINLSSWMDFCDGSKGGVWFYKSGKKTGGCGCVRNYMGQVADENASTAQQCCRLEK